MDDTAIAFELPHARAAATEGRVPPDRISVRDYTRQVEIGAFRAERGVSQRIRFNVVLEVAHHDAAEDDDVDKVVSYDTITDAIEEEIAAERINLLETLAERVAARCLADARAVRVFVRLEKLDRIPGALGVEIVRRRAAAESPRLRAVPAARPRVVHLTGRLAADPAWRDALAALGGPLVVCVEPASPQPPATTEARRRIGLLALDQAAWTLTDADARFQVAGSRTELDWALRGRRTVVWAPTHMAMAAIGGPVPDASDPAGLATWLAAEIDAGAVVFAGAPAPAGGAGLTARTPEDIVSLRGEEPR
jgi:dihydroneopterin aldolase